MMILLTLFNNFSGYGNFFQHSTPACVMPPGMGGSKVPYLQGELGSGGCTPGGVQQVWVLPRLPGLMSDCSVLLHVRREREAEAERLLGCSLSTALGLDAVLGPKHLPEGTLKNQKVTQ